MQCATENKSDKEDAFRLTHLGEVHNVLYIKLSRITISPAYSKFACTEVTSSLHKCSALKVPNVYQPYSSHSVQYFGDISYLYTGENEGMTNDLILVEKSSSS